MVLLHIFLVYVDAIILTGSNSQFLDHFVLLLAQRFSLKNLGSLHHFLGVELISAGSGLFLSQGQYINDILLKYKMDGAKVVSTPMSSVDQLVSTSSPGVDAVSYRQLVGMLQYLTITRLDVAFAINRLSQFMHAPTDSHWQAAKWVLRYLKGTLHHGLFLKSGIPLSLSAFSDSDWGEGGARDGGRSTTAYVIYFCSNVVSWKSVRHKSVSRSSIEDENRALANATAELMWIQGLL